MNQQLFDDEDEIIDDLNLELNIQDEEDEEFPTKSLTRDKIFDNDYNTGNLDFEEFANLPKVDTFYAEGHLQECYDSFEYSRNLNLEVLINQYFENTEHIKSFSKKKIPKQMMPHVFVSIREQFRGTNLDYSGSEIFSAIADYFRINYEVLYENIPSIYRAELVKELDDKYDILNKRGLKKLF